jgi:hypothetical protein
VRRADARPAEADADAEADAEADADAEGDANAEGIPPHSPSAAGFLLEGEDEDVD